MLKKLEAEFLVHKKLIAQYLFLANENIAAEKFLYEDLEPHFHKSLLPLIQAYELDAKAELKAQAIKVLADIDGTTKLIGGVSVVAIAAAIFSGLFFSYSILKPIKTLTKAVGEISEGRLNTKVKVKSKDEIGVLVNSFNQMVEHLNVTTVSKSYIDNIIKSVPDILIVADANAIITKTNKAIQLLGYQEKELLGKILKLYFQKKIFINY